MIHCWKNMCYLPKNINLEPTSKLEKTDKTPHKEKYASRHFAAEISLF